MKNGSIEYPGLVGKVIKQVRFADDEEFTALVMEFTDNTHVCFRLHAPIALKMQPEIATLKNGNISSWRRLRSRPTGKCA